MPKKIHISLFNQNKPDFKAYVQTTSKDKIILNWLINWVQEGLKEKVLEHGDLMPPKTEIANLFNVSTGTVQNAIRYAESLGHFESKQCVGTMVRDKSLNITPNEKMFSKKDSVTIEIKKIIENYKLNTPLPSIRNLAAEIKASHNTTRLALDTLVQEGYLEKKFIKGNEIKWFVVKNQINEKDKFSNTKNKTLSQKLEEKIENYIAKNYNTGDKILSNEEFATYFSVSIKTINDAMKKLNKKGIILSRRGYYGTIYISNPNDFKIKK